MCHQLVRCEVCDLVYADQPPDDGELAQAYHRADFDSGQEAADAASAYIRAARQTLAKLPRRQRALEIGTGTGVFLDELKNAGFDEVVGLEPSAAAVEAAEPHRRPWIRLSMFEEDAFEPASFDLICCFMTLEHVRDPRALTEAVYRLLRSGGAFVVVVHDYRSSVNRLMGARSPIIDIEHLQLFSRASVTQLLSNCGMQDVEVHSFSNRYRLAYWTRLAPLPAPLKAAVGAVLRKTRAGQVRVSINVGNLFASGFRSA